MTETTPTGDGERRYTGPPNGTTFAGRLDRCPDCDRLVNTLVNGDRCPFCRDETLARDGDPEAAQAP